MKQFLTIFCTVIFSLCAFFIYQKCFHFNDECVDVVEKPKLKNLKVAIFYTPESIDTVEYKCNQYLDNSYKGSNSLGIVTKSYKKCEKCGKFIVKSNIQWVLRTTAPFKVIEFK